MHDLAWWLGITDPNSPTYLFWSGVGGMVRDLLAMIGALHIHGRIRGRREGG